MTLQAPPYGRALSATTQVHHGRVVSGARLLAEAAFRRITTERGSLQDDLSYGLPVCSWVGSAVSEGDRLAAAAQIRQHIMLDPRFAQVSVDIVETRDGPVASWEIDIEGQGEEGGTFELAVAASEVSLELLRIEVQP